MLAVFGIESDGLNLAVNLLILFLVVIYLALAYWSYADARRRIADPMLIGCAAAAAILFPFVGAIVYMIVRPPEYLDDVRERELEMQAAEARMHELGFALCPHCDFEVKQEFLRCPNCMRKLKDPCTNCGRPLDPEWKLCPYCEAQIPGVTPQRRGRRAADQHRVGDPPPRVRVRPVHQRQVQHGEKEQQQVDGQVEAGRLDPEDGEHGRRG